MAYLPALLCGLFVVLSPSGGSLWRARSIAVPEADPIKVLGQWLELYHAGQLDLSGEKQRLRGRGAPMRAKDFVSITSGLFPDQDPTRFSHEQELTQLCKAVGELATAAAARALLEVAAVGLDRREYAPAMNPVVVRRIGEQQLAALPTGAGRQHVLDAATGAMVVVPIRAAALQGLGAYKDELYRPVLTAALAERNVQLRIAAVQGLLRAELTTAVLALADQLQNEPDAAARIAIIDALTAIAAKRGAEVVERDRRRAVTAVLDGLDRHGWNVDMAALDYLRLNRSVDTVPRLIGVLEAYADGDGQKDATRSKLVPYRAHELLVSLTGAVFPENQPGQWRSWWSGVQDTFTLAEAKAPPASTGDDQRTIAGSFFGIPVRGTRVLFVVDASGSMREPWGQGEIKFDVARRELRRAVENLAPDSAFNLVAFGDRADAWRDGLAIASKANKDSFAKYLDKMQTGRSTNVWAGLQLALQLKNIEQNARYATTVDEIFVLSDGTPTVGELVRPEQILATVTETNRISRIRINTIYIESPGGGTGRGGGRGGGQGRGGRGGMSGAALMKELAERNGGAFLQPKPPR